MLVDAVDGSSWPWTGIRLRDDSRWFQVLVLKPGGRLLGQAGSDESVRVLTGGLAEAEAMFQQLSAGGRVVAQTSKLTRVELPNGAGFVQIRYKMTRSPNSVATLDVKARGLEGLKKVKLNP